MPLGERPLRAVAGQRYVGTAVDATALAREPGYREDLAREFSAVTPENAMKWAVVEPDRGRDAFGQADALVSFARAHDQRVRGHTLVWYAQNPDWLENVHGDELRRVLRRHVTDVVARYRGRIADWDVVNEAVADDGTLRRWQLLNELGSRYIADAFRWAHAADPSARLWINEIAAEDGGAKTQRLYELVRGLLADGVPVGGVGFQGHFSLEGVPAGFAATLARFAALGVKVAITELDVVLKEPADEAKEQHQAAIYADAARACVVLPACVGITVWGFTDRHSWIPSNQPGSGAATLLDGDLRPKPAYAAFSAALAGG